MRKVLITGASGFLGFRTLEYLLKVTSFEFVAAARTLRLEREHSSDRVTYLYGDLEDEKYLIKLFKAKPVCIINCASLSAPWGDKLAFYKANIKTQELLIKHAVINKIQRFIYISSPSIYVNHKDRLNISEESKLFPPVNHYAWSKRVAEEKLRLSGIPYIILRPRALVGRGDTIIFPRLIRAHKEGKLRTMGNGENICDITGVVNVAHAIYLALQVEDKSALNQDFNITNDEPVMLWEEINKVLIELGYSPVRGRISQRTGYVLAFMLELSARIFKKKEPALLKYSVSTLSRSMTFDISKAKNLLNYRPILSTKKSLEEFVNWRKQDKE